MPTIAYTADGFPTAFGPLRLGSIWSSEKMRLEPQFAMRDPRGGSRREKIKDLPLAKDATNPGRQIQA